MQVSHWGCSDVHLTDVRRGSLHLMMYRVDLKFHDNQLQTTVSHSGKNGLIVRRFSSTIKSKV